MRFADSLAPSFGGPPPRRSVPIELLTSVARRRFRLNTSDRIRSTPIWSWNCAGHPSLRHITPARLENIPPVGIICQRSGTRILMIYFWLVLSSLSAAPTVTHRQPVLRRGRSSLRHIGHRPNFTPETVTARRNSSLPAFFLDDTSVHCADAPALPARDADPPGLELACAFVHRVAARGSSTHRIARDNASSIISNACDRPGSTRINTGGHEHCRPDGTRTPH